MKISINIDSHNQITSKYFYVDNFVFAALTGMFLITFIFASRGLIHRYKNLKKKVCNSNTKMFLD